MAAGGYRDFALLTGDDIAILDNLGRVSALDASDSGSLRAGRTQAWENLIDSTVHGGLIVVVNDNGSEKVLYTVDGMNATTAARSLGVSFESLLSAGGSEFYYTTKNSSSELALHHLNTSTFDSTEITITGQDTSASNGSFHSFEVVDTEIVFVYSKPGTNLLVKATTAAPTSASLVKSVGSGTLRAHFGWR